MGYQNLTLAQQDTMLRFDAVVLDDELANTTHKAYRGHIVQYLCWLDRNRERLRQETSERKVELFLLHRTVHDRVGWVTRKQAFCALLYLYKRVLRRDVKEIRKIRMPAQKKHLPVLLDPQQVLDVLAAIEDSPATPFRLIACLLYGCGLRISEGLKLRIKDVSLTESRLILRDTKGRCDVNKPIPCCLLVPLERQIGRVRLLWQQDRERGLAVSLPGLEGLRRKYPQISHAWGWQYLFPQHSPCRNPQARPEDRTTLYRHHQGDWGVQRAVKAAAAKCELEGVLTPHALRHAFATHLDGRGEQLTTIQAMLGHKDVRTTMVYVHRHVTRVESPLDHTLRGASGSPVRIAAPSPLLSLPFTTA